MTMDIHRDFLWKQFLDRTRTKNTNVQFEYENYMNDRLVQIFQHVHDYPESSNCEIFTIRMGPKFTAQILIETRRKASTLYDVTVWDRTGIILELKEYCSLTAKQELALALSEHRALR